MDEIYCLKCRTHTPNVDENIKHIIVKKRDRRILQALCSMCGKKKNKFLKNEPVAEQNNCVLNEE